MYVDKHVLLLCVFVQLCQSGCFVLLFVLPVSCGEQLVLIISNEPAVVKGPSHSHSPERQMNI